MEKCNTVFANAAGSMWNISFSTVFCVSLSLLACFVCMVCFPRSQFMAAGAEITDDLSDASVILGVKQIPRENIMPERTYVFFSHVIKAQENNMPLLDTMLQQRSRLIDYECINRDGIRGGQRLIAFGRFAGLAGMVDMLRGVGERLLSQGYSTPFLSMGSTYMYPNLSAAQRAVAELGQQLQQQRLQKEIAPMTFVFTGTGNVSLGAQEIFKLLPHEMVEAKDLPQVAATGRNDILYGCVATAADMVEHRKKEPFDKLEYYEHPDRFRSVFHERVIPYTSVLMNCMYWAQRFPRLLTKSQIQKLWQNNQRKLLAVGDITCDVGGSVEFLTKATEIEAPFFLYDAANNETRDKLDGEGICMLGVDILPSELPREASKHFGDLLLPYVQLLCASDATIPFQEQKSHLPTELHGACITSNGRLTPNFKYIAPVRQLFTHAAASPV